ncbi:hypothetical protein Dsi01nite_089280 [Dactylosporangium siamense]|uniref:Uncharacterized protein n=1 Tax=Dactylosporangium siamense TaxID=685454 RepID=A0A919PVB5_9ACTN|nr:hypothetical protein Dsi01nite_089280 [Dactylosporangium siamense]
MPHPTGQDLAGRDSFGEDAGRDWAVGQPGGTALAVLFAGDARWGRIGRWTSGGTAQRDARRGTSAGMFDGTPGGIGRWEVRRDCSAGRSVGLTGGWGGEFDRGGQRSASQQDSVA